MSVLYDGMVGRCALNNKHHDAEVNLEIGEIPLTESSEEPNPEEFPTNNI
jgi:hypothetical protein